MYAIYMVHLLILVGPARAGRWEHDDAGTESDGDKGAMQEQRRGGFCARRISLSNDDRRYLS